MNNANRVVEVHQRKVRNIFYSEGVAHVEAKAIAGLCEDSAYEKHKLCDGTSPTVSMNDKGNIVFVCNTSNQLRHTLPCHTGTLDTK